MRETSEADVTGALGRAISALANAQSAVASLATAVGAAQKAAERAEREAQRVTADARARITTAEANVETLRSELGKGRDETENERRAYRRGYLAGRSVAQRGAGTDDVEADADNALERRRGMRSVA